jgi:hypothetical protein
LQCSAAGMCKETRGNAIAGPVMACNVAEMPMNHCLYLLLMSKLVAPDKFMELSLQSCAPVKGGVKVGQCLRDRVVEYAGWSSTFGRWCPFAAALLEAVAVGVLLQDVGMMGDPPGCVHRSG